MHCTTSEHWDAWSSPIDDGAAPRNGPSGETSTEGRLQRSRGALEIEVEGGFHGPRIGHVFQSSPLRVLFPGRRRDRTKRGVIINTAGGIAGGDALRFEITARGGASMALTSQTAERVYRTLDQPGVVDTRLSVDRESALAWLPQETIVFNGARLHRTTTLDLSAGSEALVLESLMLGRLASGEVLDRGEIVDGWSVWIEGRLVWADRLRIGHDLIRSMGREALLANHRALATLVYVGRESEARVLDVRRQSTVPGTLCVATQVGAVTVIRVAAPDARRVRDALKRILRPFQTATDTVFQTPMMWP